MTPFEYTLVIILVVVLFIAFVRSVVSHLRDDELHRDHDDETSLL